jgi:hypothetical protein
VSDPALDFTDPLEDGDDQGGLNFDDPMGHDPVIAAQAEVTGNVGDGALGALDGMLMNYGGELEKLGLGAALGNKLADWTGASRGRPEGQPHDNSSVTPIDDALKTKAGRGGNLVGNMMGGGALGLATGGAGGYLAQGAIGAGQGVVAGVGAREGEERFDPASMGKDASIGGAFGVGGRALGTLIGKVAAARNARAPAPVPVDAAVNGAPSNAGRAMAQRGVAAKPMPVEPGAPDPFDGLLDRYAAPAGPMSRVPSGLDVDTSTLVPSTPPGHTISDIPTDTILTPQPTLADIPYGRGAMGRGAPAAGPYGTARMPAPNTAVDLPYDVHASPATTIRDIPYDSAAATMPSAPMPGTMARTVPNRAPRPAPVPAPYQRSQEALELGEEVPELAAQAAQPGVAMPGAQAAAAMPNQWADLLPQAVKLMAGANPVKRAGVSMALRLLQKQAGKPPTPRPTYAPDPRGLLTGATMAGEASRARFVPDRFVAKPDVKTLTWAMQSMNARGASGLPPDEQAQFDEVLLSGDANKISAAYMRLSMKYPRFQKMAAEQLESINDDGGG